MYDIVEKAANYRIKGEANDHKSKYIRQGISC